MSAWNHWYHCTAHTYGAWLPGDSRGWRSRDHKIHVEGDYKNPPAPGTDAGLLQYSREMMDRDAVKIPQDLREFLLNVVVVRISELDIHMAVGSLDATHLHLLLQCPRKDPKIIVGIAKQYATAQLKAQGLADGLKLRIGEGLWAKGSHAKPITGPDHFANSARYILDHAMKGAAVWRTPTLSL